MSTQPDLTEFYRLSAPKKPPCRIGHAIQQLKGQDRANLLAALEQPQNVITAGAIEKWLTARDLPASTSAVHSHRNQRCTCSDA